MSGAISGVSSSSYMPSLMSGGPRGAKRPDSDEMAAKIFSQLDTNNQGYLQASDLSSAVSALGQQANSSGTSDSSSGSSDDLFAVLDSDSDGKVTKSELSTALKAVSDELDSQFNAMRVANGMSGMQGPQGSAPPPPPPSGGGHHGGGKGDQGLSQDQLSSMASRASEAGDTTAADRFSQLASNFEAADTDGDGKVSFAESIAYEKSQQESEAASDSASSDSTTTASTSTTDSTSPETSVQDDSKQAMLKKLMELARSYRPDTSVSATSSALNLAV